MQPKPAENDKLEELPEHVNQAREICYKPIVMLCRDLRSKGASRHAIFTGLVWAMATLLRRTTNIGQEKARLFFHHGHMIAHEAENLPVEPSPKIGTPWEKTEEEHEADKAAVASRLLPVLHELKEKYPHGMVAAVALREFLETLTSERIKILLGFESFDKRWQENPYDEDVQRTLQILDAVGKKTGTPH